MSSTLPSVPSNKLLYIDHIKVLLTILVVLHHTVVAYSSNDGWYYTEKSSHLAALVPMKMFLGINQSFFMGFFFLLSAYFTAPSYDRKGARKFIIDRLLRLGLPLVFYCFVLSPFISYLVYYFAKGHPITYLQYLSGYDTWIDPGVMWFVAALLVFNFCYVIGRSLGSLTFKKTLAAPSILTILLFAVSLGLLSFLIRIIFPVGWVLKPLGFQLGHFPQYIALFIIGLIAFRNQWFDGLSKRTGKYLKWSAWLCLLFFPVFFVIQVKLKMPVAWYAGGFHWQSLLYALWEQWIGISILTTLLIWGKRVWNTSSMLFGSLVRCSFAVYIFHPIVIVALTLLLRNWAVDAAVKLLIVAPLAVLGSFLLGKIILWIPGVERII